MNEEKEQTVKIRKEKKEKRKEMFFGVFVSCQLVPDLFRFKEEKKKRGTEERQHKEISVDKKERFSAQERAKGCLRGDSLKSHTFWGWGIIQRIKTASWADSGQSRCSQE